MQDFETREHDSESTEVEHEERGKSMFRYLLKRFILLVSFGPGVLGFLWLIKKIVRR
jgi:hypothetical protein